MRGEEARIYCGGMASEAVERLLVVGDSRQQRRAEDSRDDAGSAQLLHSLKTQVGAWGAWFQQPGELRIWSCNRHVNDKCVAPGDLLEQIDVAPDEPRFGDDSEAVSRLARENLEQAASNLCTALDRLVRISCGAERNLHPGVDLLQLLLEQPRGILFEEDHALEGKRVAEA